MRTNNTVVEMTIDELKGHKDPNKVMLALLNLRNLLFNHGRCDAFSKAKYMQAGVDPTGLTSHVEVDQVINSLIKED